MKHMRFVIVGAVLMGTFSAFGDALTDQAVKFVPGGKIVQQRQREVKLQTTAGSIVEVEFERDGSFEEASGDNLGKDVFIPGEGKLGLKAAVESLKKQGKSPVGGWNYEKSFLKGWHYEFEGFEDGQKMDYVVDAKDGKLLESKVDD